MHTPTVTARFARALLSSAESLGLELAEPVEIDQARVPLAAQDALWRRLVEASRDPLIGLRLGLSLQVGHLDVTGLLLMSCETLGEALEVLPDYLPIIGEGGEAQLNHEANQLELRYIPHYRICREQRVEMVMACLLQLTRWSTGGHLPTPQIRFSHAPRDDEERYQQLLGCPVHFETGTDALLLPSEAGHQTLIQANAPLRDQLRELADAALRALGERSLSDRVARCIRQRPQAGKDEIASAVAMSGRHLNRLLAEEGWSFKSLRERELRSLAEQALRRGEKIAVLAQTLGFSDESAFAKAFRRWSGVSPGQFRRT